MYLAPLNYDRFLKKIFSDLDIAKKILEDFLDVEIQEISLMKTNHKITDGARAVEFDFHCKIADHQVIIDMQQWYKSDTIYRFYPYHCIGTALQLEQMPVKSILLQDGKLQNVKDYSNLVPVITIIWMVDDGLGFSDDYACYTMLPEKAKILFETADIWKNKDLEKHVKDVISTINNNNKGLKFLQKNRLFFAFQQNIVANKKFSKYLDWFTLAQKTRNKLNKKSDFDEYKKDETFVKIIKRISKEDLNKEDLKYIDDYQQQQQQVELYNDGMRKEGIEQEKKRSETIVKQAELNSLITKLYYKDQKNIDEIAKITQTDKEYIKNVVD